MTNTADAQNIITIISIKGLPNEIIIAEVIETVYTSPVPNKFNLFNITNIKINIAKLFK